MTFVDDIANNNSPVSKHLDHVMVGYDDVAGDLYTKLETTTDCGLSDTADPTTAGLAIETAICCDLAPTVPYQRLLKPYPLDRSLELVRAAGFEPPASPNGGSQWTKWNRAKLPSGMNDEETNRFLIAAVSFAEQRRLLHEWARSDNAHIMQDAWLWDLLPPATDAMWLQPLWNTYREQGRPALTAITGHVRVAPILMDKYAEADVIIGSSVIDVKASNDPQARTRQWIRQATGYALMDDTCDHAGLYLARHGLLVTWPLRRLLGLAERDELSPARQRFTQVASRAAEW